MAAAAAVAVGRVESGTEVTRAPAAAGGSGSGSGSTSATAVELVKGVVFALDNAATAGLVVHVLVLLLDGFGWFWFWFCRARAAIYRQISSRAEKTVVRRSKNQPVAHFTLIQNMELEKKTLAGRGQRAWLKRRRKKK